MKRLVSVLLCLAFIFTLVSCKEKKTTSAVQPKVISLSEVKSYMQKGEILGVDLKLGDTVQDVSKHYEITTAATSKEQTTVLTGELPDEKFLNIYGEDIIKMAVDSRMYCYKKVDESKGISVIVSFKSAYKFDVGIDTSEEIIYSLGQPEKQSIPTKEEAFFMLNYSDNMKMLTYYNGKIKLDFIFTDDVLQAVALTDTAVWK